jgi:hypothetical protein
MALNHNDEIEPDKAKLIAAGIYDEIEARRKSRTNRGIQLTTKIFRARLDCLIFFALVSDGWGRAIRLPSGAMTTVDSPASQVQRLGYPTRYRLWIASKRVRQTCPAEAAQYKQAFRAWKEARERYMAAETEESWNRYYETVRYHTRVALARRGGVEHYYKRRMLRYMAHEMRARKEERRRALEEMRQGFVA